LPHFTLEEYFKRYSSRVPKTIRRIETVTKTQNYSPNQEDLSREYKKVANFQCQSCTVNCSSDTSLLHLHHEDGDRSNNEHKNLRVLCVDCHSKQPMHSQILNNQTFISQINIIKSLRKDQGIIDLEA